MKILLLSCKNPFQDPRPSRMLNFLKDFGTVFVGCYEDIEDYPNIYPIRVRFLKKFFQRIVQILFPKTTARFFHQFTTTLKIHPNYFNLIVCHDLVLLPFAVHLKRQSHRCILIFDAREYYPLEFESRLLWKLQFKRLYSHLCNFYLSLCDLVLTVSHGLKDLYEDNFHITPTVLYSLPVYHDLIPSKVQKYPIKMIYHGAANADRGLETLIDAMRILGPSYQLTLVLVKGSEGQHYMDSLKKYAKDLPIAFKEPFLLSEIIEKTNEFDIGLCCFPPSTRNLKHAMPNKLFEYIQARLMVISTPLCDLKKFIERENIGKVTQGFSKNDIVSLLRSLSYEEIQFYKNVCSKKAKEFSNEGQMHVLSTFIKSHAHG